MNAGSNGNEYLMDLHCEVDEDAEYQWYLQQEKKNG
jgi:hypothetical protein